MTAREKIKHKSKIQTVGCKFADINLADVKLCNSHKKGEFSQ